MFNDDIRSGWMVSVLPCERKIEGTAVKETYTLINLSPHPHTNIKWPMMQHFILEQSRENKSLVFLANLSPPGLDNFTGIKYQISLKDYFANCLEIETE